MADPKNILIVQPNWIGDAVMATPMLRAMRRRFAEASIAYLTRRYVKPIFAGMPYADRVLTYRNNRTRGHPGNGEFFDLAARLRAGRFDLAVLLPNSFKSALVCRLAGIPRVFGYERDGRGFLLTDRLIPQRESGRFVPTPIVDYYLALAGYLGAEEHDGRMELFVTPTERREAMEVLRRAGLQDLPERPGARGHGPLVVLNVGAQYGAAKCWLPEHFAAVADRLVEQRGATVLVSGSPRERPIVDAVLRQSRHALVDLLRYGSSLGALKEIVRRSDLMITNDTGPRHIAAAFGVPVVTVFGPTHPQWTEIGFALERQVSVKVFCGPCQKKLCPLDHRCMTRVTPGMVLEASGSLLDRPAAASAR